MDEKEKIHPRIQLLKDEGMSDEEILGLMKLQARDLPNQIPKLQSKIAVRGVSEALNELQDKIDFAESYIAEKEK